MKSLAHPEWPYIGTGFQWRGFGNTLADETKMPKVYPQYVGSVLIGVAKVDESQGGAIYQKQKLGPDLT